MAREFSHRSLHGAPRARRRLFFVTLLILFLLLLDVLSGGKIRAGIRSLTVRTWSAFAQVSSTVSSNGYLATKRALAHENSTLREQVANYQEKAAGYDAIKSENDTLRDLLAMRKDPKGITAPVISSYRASPYGTFLIAAGSADGVHTGDLVLSEGGFVVGAIAELSSQTALVKTLFASGLSVDAVLDEAALTFEGRGGGNAKSSAPRGLEISVGDIVYAPSFGQRPVAVVGRVDSSETSADQTIYVNLPVNISTLRFVYIVSHE